MVVFTFQIGIAIDNSTFRNQSVIGQAVQDLNWVLNEISQKK
ncbi:MAG: hypothetical protein WAM14_21660 [Candidatus Nitrosopolaris sp.]